MKRRNCDVLVYVKMYTGKIFLKCILCFTLIMCLELNPGPRVYLASALPLSCVSSPGQTLVMSVYGLESVGKDKKK